MQKNVKVTFWVLLLCMGGFLVAWNMRLMFLGPSAVVLAISPEKIEFQTAFPEGSEFQAEFTLENKTRSDLLVKKLKPSCGCTSLSTKDGLPIEVPFVLSPSTSLPILVVVNTKSIVGKRNEAIFVQYEYRGKSFMVVGTIVFDVVPAPSQEIQEISN